MTGDRISMKTLFYTKKWPNKHGPPDVGWLPLPLHYLTDHLTLCGIALRSLGKYLGTLINVIFWF